MLRLELLIRILLHLAVPEQPVGPGSAGAVGSSGEAFASDLERVRKHYTISNWYSYDPQRSNQSNHPCFNRLYMSLPNNRTSLIKDLTLPNQINHVYKKEKILDLQG